MSEPSGNEDKTVFEKTERYPGDLLFGWTSSKQAGSFVFFGISILCVVLFAADFIIHRHEYLHIAEFPVFYALFGFASFAGVVLSGWPLRRLLGRPENYYEPEETSRD